MRYDAAIIGAGADGLAAAATLAGRGLKTIVLERNEKPGGRCTTREFHPGFRAAPFCDELAPIPAKIFWKLDLARRGVTFLPAPQSTSIWPDRQSVLTFGAEQPAVLDQGTTLARAALRRARRDEEPARQPSLFGGSAPPPPWPGEEWAAGALSEFLASKIDNDDLRCHLTAYALSGRAAHPDFAGSALHLLAPGTGGAGMVAGGLHRLADALVSAASDAGAEISCGLEVTEIHRAGNRTSGVMLADGTQIEARTVLSTLDLKRTFLSLFQWNALPSEVSRRVASFRMAAGTARVLFALAKPPEGISENTLRGPIFVAPDGTATGAAYAAWHSGTIADKPPIVLRVVSAADPRLCPLGAATMTATLGCIPARPFDGPWTREKRDALRRLALAAAETVFPDISAHVLAADVIAPPDIEEALGVTDGDLWGGEIVSDQMLGLRPWLDRSGPRTAFAGVYLAGPSSAVAPFATCAAGVIAANAILTDLKTGWPR